MSLDVSLAIDGDAVAEALVPHVPGLERCTPRHVRYKPGHHCHVLYNLVVDGACTAGHLMMLSPRRAERLWSRLVESRLPERAGVPACHVGELARLHATKVAALPAFSAERELEDLRAAVEVAAALLPELRGAIDRLAAR